MTERRLDLSESRPRNTEWYLDGSDTASHTYAEIKPATEKINAEEALDHANAQFTETAETFDDRAAHRYIATVSGHLTRIRNRTAELV